MNWRMIDAGGGTCAPSGAPAQLIAYRVFISYCKMSCVPRIPGDDLRNETKRNETKRNEMAGRRKEMAGRWPAGGKKKKWPAGGKKKKKRKTWIQYISHSGRFNTFTYSRNPVPWNPIPGTPFPGGQ